MKVRCSQPPGRRTRLPCSPRSADVVCSTMVMPKAGAMGHSAIPLACRQFPRQSVRDPRGVSVTLSHYCPTANDLLSSHTGEVSIVTNPPAFPADAEHVGFEADPSLPPLLHPQLAMDWNSWWLFEEMSVALLATESQPLDRLALAVEQARNWNVGAGPLLTHVRNAFQFATEASLTEQPLSSERIDARTADALSAVPEDWRALAAETVETAAASALDDQVVRRFLAAHAFANWAAYQGEGLRTWFRAIETAACLLQRTQDPGQVDLILRHLGEPEALVERLKEIEEEPLGPADLQVRGTPRG
jgi:hypothetical protein